MSLFNIESSDNFFDLFLLQLIEIIMSCFFNDILVLGMSKNGMILHDGSYFTRILIFGVVNLLKPQIIQTYLNILFDNIINLSFFRIFMFTPYLLSFNLLDQFIQSFWVECMWPHISLYHHQSIFIESMQLFDWLFIFFTEVYCQKIVFDIARLILGIFDALELSLWKLADTIDFHIITEVAIFIGCFLGCQCL